MADRTGLLPVARKAGGGEDIERRPFRPAGELGLADAGPPIQALERPDVEVLTGMGAGEDGQFGWLEVERVDAACLDEGDQPERLDRGSQCYQAVGVAELADDPAGDIGLDDVAAVDALLDAVTQVPGEDRGDDPAAGGRGDDGRPWAAQRATRAAGAGTVDGTPMDAAVAPLGGRGYPHDW